MPQGLGLRRETCRSGENLTILWLHIERLQFPEVSGRVPNTPRRSLQNYGCLRGQFGISGHTAAFPPVAPSQAMTTTRARRSKLDFGHTSTSAAVPVPRVA